MEPADAEDLLRSTALRVTRPRLAVLAAVHSAPHADTESITTAVRAQIGAVSHQAVYDVLKALTEVGLLRRLQPAGSLARYEARVGDNHHHVVCRSCGAISDVDCATGETPCLTAVDDAGYTIDEAEVVYWGRCASCTISPDPLSADPSSADPLSADPLSADPSSADPLSADPSSADPSSPDHSSPDPMTPAHPSPSAPQQRGTP